MAQHRPPVLAAHLIKMPSLRMRIVLVLVLYACCMRMATDLPVSAQPTNGAGQKLWCVAKPSAPDNVLQANLNFACGEGGADCTQIQHGNACYNPNTLISHASYAMNMYYQRHGRNYWNCYFENSGLVVFTDPSYGHCIYPPQ